MAGPTASGKSHLGLRLAEALDGVVINADSVQVYRDLSVLSARPDAATCAHLPHRLYGFAAGDQPISAATWLALAQHEIKAATAAGRVPIIVGGSGLYLEAMLSVLCDIPDFPAAVWRDSCRRLDTMGREAFCAWLAGVDPASARRLPPGDSHRLLRAAEVWLATGRPLSDWQAAGRRVPVAGGRLLAPLALLLSPDRTALYDAIERRFDAMIAAGACDEVRRLVGLGLDRRLPVMRALGVPQLMAHDQGELTLAEAVDEAKTRSRRYAKRQMTWFRNRYPVAEEMVFTQLSESYFDIIVSKVRRWLLTHHSPETSFSLPSG
ncbi:MAG: tRNA (adenosine(37)-N6)-dimethylallyltransferase MiaA [Alphaproteobacteria bacterium]